MASDRALLLLSAPAYAPPMRAFLSALLLSACVLSTVFGARISCAAAGVPAPSEPRMVQPESLEQGFIIVVNDAPGVASSEYPIILASNHNGWNPADQKMKLTRRSDGKWQIDLPKPTLDSRMAFKFARGSWERVEVSADFKDIDNRQLPLVDAAALKPGEKPIIELSVPAWRDQRPWETVQFGVNPYRKITVAAGTIRRLETTGGGAVTARDVLVWLPPGYDDPANAARTYPVLYLHDGQNVFEKLPGVPGEWRADETAAELIEQGRIEPLIIVAIPHAGAARASEYLPVAAVDGVTPRADAYADFVVNEVMPRVARTLRTRTGPENTAIGGASFGAVVSLHTALRHPGVFGKLLLESMPVLARDRLVLRHFQAPGPAFPPRIVIGMGGREAGPDADARINAAYADSASDLRALCIARGVSEDNVLLVVDPAAVHNEDAWAKRLPGALQFLFGRR